MTCSLRSAAVALVLLASAACANKGGSNEVANAAQGDSLVNSTAEAPAGAPNTSSQATNTPAADQPTRSTAAGSILAWSRPAAGSIVKAPVDELVFHFSPPARLGEVTVSGPEGAMAMMVRAVGEAEHYSLPLSGVAPGQYTVAWKATARGVDYNGSFRFEVR